MTNQRKQVMFDELSSDEIAEAAKASTVVIFPFGSIEAHSTHLPLCTDSIQAEYIAVEVAKKTGSIVAPPVRFGICNATRNFPGTLTIQFNTLYALVHDLLSELVRSGFRRILIISGHAGNSHMVMLRLASQDIVSANEAKGVRVMVLSDFDFADELIPEYAAVGDGHAGTIETSRVMAIRPDLVKGKGKADVWRMPRFEVIAHPELCIPSAVHGDPTAATKEKGEKINRYIIEKVAELVEELKR
ncbi:creatininase family protein [Candidatus Bathyarchaeota archaeon]|nr:creatininase family protein [Candidatus Bathyarchaeota archaeon]